MTGGIELSGLIIANKPWVKKMKLLREESLMIEVFQGGVIIHLYHFRFNAMLESNQKYTWMLMLITQKNNLRRSTSTQSYLPLLPLTTDVWFYKSKVIFSNFAANSHRAD